MALQNRLEIRAVPDGKGPHNRQPEEIDAFLSEDSLSETPFPADLYGPGRSADAQTFRVTPVTFSRVAKWIGAIGGSALIVAAVIWGYQQVPAAVAPGSFSLETTPSGLVVEIDGKPVGKTPVNVSLAAGEYSVGLTEPDGRQRTFKVALTAGGSVVRQLEFAPAAAAKEGTGALRVETTPARQPVSVDGVDRGMSPVTVSSLTPGDHIVVVRGQNNNNVRRTFSVKEGETVSLVVTVPAESATTLRAGWVTFSAPFSLSLREGGRLIGTTDAERLMLPAGDHEIEMTNDALGYRATRRVIVAPDRTTTVPVEVPTGTVSINAQPWAEVWIGGERIGETPIANLSRPIGVHEIVFRHPQFGERKARITVTTKQTARLGVDMRTP